MSHHYGLVEPMQYLFIRIEKARGLAPNESPFLKIRTSTHSMRSNPVSHRPGQPKDSPEWHQVFALSYNKPDSASPTVEISVWDFPSENFLGGVCFDLSDVPVRDQRDSPLAPQWYQLEAGAYQHPGRITGDLQLSVWIDTLADEAFPEAKLTSPEVSVRGSSSMANVNGVPGDGGYSGYHYVEELVPFAGWTEDSNCHYLQIRLPGFKKEQFRLEVASTDNLILSGERMVNESKAVYVSQTYKLPEDSDAEQITGKYDDALYLNITVPKLARQEEKEDEKEHTENVSSITPGNNPEEPARNSENLGRHDDGGYDCRRHSNNEKKVDQSEKTGRVDSFSEEFITQLEAGPRGRAIDLLGIVLAIGVAFALGVLVSRRFESK
ncbi:hypothetical protein SLE2022_290090 [Rubroshorea leprosula]